MPISEQSPVNSYTGNGSVTTFPYTFKIFSNTDLKVTVDGVVKTLTTDYTVTGVGEEGGGTVVFSAPQSTGAKIVIYRDLPYNRNTDYVENGDLLAYTLDNDIDREIMLIQQLRDDIKRAVKFPKGETTDQVISESAANRASKFIGFNTAGALTLKTVADLGGAYTIIGDGLQVVDNNLSISGEQSISQKLKGDALFLRFKDTGDSGVEWGIRSDGGNFELCENTGSEGTPTWTVRQTISSASMALTGTLNEAYATVASHATTAPIWAATGNLINYTGTAVATAFPNAPQAGARRTLICAAACGFTAGANMLINGISSGNTYTATAGDRIVIEAISTTQFKLTITRYDGKSIPEVSGVRDSTRNLIIKNHASNPNYQLTITANEVVLQDNNNNFKLFLALSETLDITASGANGLDTGSEAVSTWYHIWAIGKADGTLDTLLSTSATSPTMPSNYTFKAYLGAVNNNSSSNFKKMYQTGKTVHVQLSENIVFTGATAPASYGILEMSTAVPTTAKLVTCITGLTVAGYRVHSIAGDSSGLGAKLSSGGGSGAILEGFYGGAAHPDVPLITAQTVYWMAENPSNNNHQLGVSGYKY